MIFPGDLTLSLPPAETCRALLEQWHWFTGPGDWSAVSMTRFGDWFLRSSTGAIWFLDVTTPSFKQIATSLNDAIRAAARQEARDEWFMADLVQLAEDRGIRLSAGQCLGWKVPP